MTGHAKTKHMTGTREEWLSARLELLERRRVTLIARLNRARKVDDTRDDRYSRSLLEHRTRSTQRDVEWVDELIEAERALANPEVPEGSAVPVELEAQALDVQALEVQEEGVAR